MRVRFDIPFIVRDTRRRAPTADSERLDAETRRALLLDDGYQSYHPYDPYFYLNRTLHWAAFLADQEEVQSDVADGAVRSEL